jgi:hypothetical protein
MGNSRPARIRKNPIPWGTNTESAEAMEFLKMLGLIPDEDDSSVRFKANLLTGNIGETVCCEITPCEDNLFIYVYSLRNKNWRMSCIGQIVTTMDELNKKFGDYIPSSFYAIIREGYVEVDMNAVNKRRNVIPGFQMNNSAVKTAPVTKNPKMVFEILVSAVKVGQRVICNVMEKENHDILIGVVSNTLIPFPVCFNETNMEYLMGTFGDYIPTEFVATVTAVHGNTCEVEIDMESVAKHKDVIPGFHMESNNQADETLARILGEFHNAAKLDQFASPDDMPPEYSAKWANAYQIYQNGLENLMQAVAKALDA